ncbi:MAG: rhomboid family intramembrane serine protease [Bacteroidetes bacterium]|nr:rhomboid family intramembrane serine protease [Bacteroidota bacterium]
MKFGILPRQAEGLIGIITAPFIHANYDHLLSNTLPLLVVGSGLIYFYREIAFRMISLIWLFTGFWVWIAARPDSHIGASGLIYGFVVFLFFSGIFRKDRRLLSISLLVTFLYGGMVWGILPVDQTISWESHLFGSLAGILCAVYFRKEGPQAVVHVWEEDDAIETGNEYWKEQNPSPIPPSTDSMEINYSYKKNDDTADEKEDQTN